MSNYWFRPKRYGYGSVPVTWQGWAVIGAAVIGIAVAASLVLPHHVKNPWAWVAFFAIEAAILTVCWIVSRRKTEGGFRWRWGGEG